MLLAGWERLSYIRVKLISPAASQHQMWEQPRMHFHLCHGCGSCAANVPAVVRMCSQLAGNSKAELVLGYQNKCLLAAPESQPLQAAPRCKSAPVSAWQLALGSFVDANCTLMLSTAGN